MNSYALLKDIHVATVVITGSLFLLRGFWMMTAPQYLQLRWVRIFPHVNDSILLASAIVLAVMSRQYPLAQDWLTAKVVALVVYIVLGTLALKRGRTKGIRITAFMAALAVYVYIVAVAFTRNPLLWGVG